MSIKSLAEKLRSWAEQAGKDWLMPPGDAEGASAYQQQTGCAEVGELFAQLGRTASFHADVGYWRISPSDVIEAWSLNNELLAGGDFNGMNEGETPKSPAMKADYWNPKWIPFATTGGGDYLCVDLDPTSAGKVGQVITMLRGSVSRRDVLAPSLEAFLQSLVSGLETGALVEHDGSLHTPYRAPPGPAGQLSLTAEFPATVFFDEKILGRTPLNTTLPIGNHELRLQTDDGMAARAQVAIAAAAPCKQHVTF